MSSINVPIGPQAFEIIRDRIGLILAQELLTQFQLNYDDSLRANVWVERFVPFDLPTEYPSVNVQLAEGNYGGQTQIQSDGTYRYFIDCYVGAKTSNKNGPADQFAMWKLQRLMGVVRSIIEYSGYKTLGFSTPLGFIMNRHWEGLQIANPDQKRIDSESSVMGRLVLSVKAPETNDLVNLSMPLNQLYTQWELSQTSKGYLWVYNTSSTIVGSSSTLNYSFAKSINVPIGPQSFEIVRDRIGRILAQELLTQFQLNYDDNLRANVWIERFVPFDLATEYPSVNIQLAEGNYSGQTQIQSDGTYRYYVDCYVGAKSSKTNGPGDQLAMAKLQRLMGVVRSIIEYSGYKTLGFNTPPGFIMNRHWEGLHIANPDQKRVDAESSVMGRLVLSVKVPENNDLGSLAKQLNVLYTHWKLSSTDRGYLWVTNATSRIFDVSFDRTYN